MRKNNTFSMKVLVWLYLILYPILPSYTRLFGYTVYSLLSISFLLITLFFNINNISRISKKYLLATTSVIVLYLVPFLAHGEYDRILYEVIEILIPITFLLLAFRRFNKTDIESAISILIGVSALLCVFGIIEFLTSFNVFSLIENMQYDNPRFGSIAATRLGIIRIEQSFNTALTYALYLLMAFSLSFYKFFKDRKKIYLVIMILQIVNVMLTMTRGISLVFIAGTCVLFLVNNKYIGLKRTASIALFLVLLMVGVVLAFPDVLGSINDMLGSAINLIIGGQNDIDQSGFMRQTYQAAAFNALKNFNVVLFGVGEYGLRDLVSIDNEWLLEITAYGIFGLLGFIIFLSVPVISIFKAIKYCHRLGNKHEEFFFKCMLVMLIEYYVSIYTVAQMAEAKMFYLVLVIIIAYSRIVSWEYKENDINYSPKL